MNRLEVGAGIVILGFGVWQLVTLLLSIRSLSPGNVAVVGITSLISLEGLMESIVIVWATSSAGVALIVDGLHRKEREKQP